MPDAVPQYRPNPCVRVGLLGAYLDLVAWLIPVKRTDMRITCVNMWRKDGNT